MKCNATTKNGKRCNRKAKKDGFCYQHSNLNKKGNKFSLNFLWAKLGAVGIALIFVMDIFDFFDIGKPWNDYIKTPIIRFINQPSFENEMGLKVLLLPFTPTKDCTIENTFYEDEIEARLEKLGLLKNEFIQVIKHTSGECIRKDSEAKKKLDKYKADIVVWGLYDEDCDTDNKIRIKYQMSDKKIEEYRILGIPESGDTGMQRLENIMQIEEGEFSNDLENIIYQLIALAYLKKGDLIETARYFSKLRDLKNESPTVNIFSRIFLRIVKKKDKFEYLTIIREIVEDFESPTFDYSGGLERKEKILFKSYLEIALEYRKSIEYVYEIHDINSTSDDYNLDQSYRKLNEFCSNNLGSCHKLATTYFEKALEVDSSKNLLMKQMALVDYYCGYYDSAIKKMQKILNVYPQDKLIKNTIKHAYERKVAIDSLEQIVFKYRRDKEIQKSNLVNSNLDSLFELEIELDTFKLKNGQFEYNHENEKSIITRSSHSDFQIEESSKRKLRYRIQWIRNNRYKLLSSFFKRGQKVEVYTEVNIFEVDEDIYRFVWRNPFLNEYMKGEITKLN